MYFHLPSTHKNIVYITCKQNNFFLVQVKKWSLLDRDFSIPGGELGMHFADLRRSSKAFSFYNGCHGTAFREGVHGYFIHDISYRISTVGTRITEATVFQSDHCRQALLRGVISTENLNLAMHVGITGQHSHYEPSQRVGLVAIKSLPTN